MLEILRDPPTTTIEVKLTDGEIEVYQDGQAKADGTIELKKKQVVVWTCQESGLTHLVLVIKGAVKAATGEFLAAKPSSPVPNEAYWWTAQSGSVLEAIQVKDRGLSDGDEWQYGLVLCLAGSEAVWLDPRIIIRPS